MIDNAIDKKLKKEKSKEHAKIIKEKSKMTEEVKQTLIQT